MQDDLATSPQARPPATILRGNSKFLERILPANCQFDAVITSPPCPNRYSYTRETRPQMFFLGLIQDGRAVGELETESIGGTWGKATSVLNGPYEYRSDIVRRVLQGVPEQVGERSLLMQNYIVKYFNDMEQHIQSLKPFLEDRAKLAYVIGNSKFYDILLPSEAVLADLFTAHDFEIAAAHQMRRRNSKSELYETVLFLGNHRTGSGG